MDQDLIVAYIDTKYVFEANGRLVTLRIGVPSRALRAVHKMRGVQRSAFLTACNPESRRLSAEENQQRNRSLVDDFAALGLPFLPGEGISEDGQWHEESFLVLGIGLPDARRLARKYEQHAFIFSRAECEPWLIETRAEAIPRTDPQTLAAIQAHFHAVIRGRAADLIDEHQTILPELSDFASDPIEGSDHAWFRVPGMYGGFAYWFEGKGRALKLVTESWCRVAGGSGQRHEITAQGAILVDEGFV